MQIAILDPGIQLLQKLLSSLFPSNLLPKKLVILLNFDPHVFGGFLYFFSFTLKNADQQQKSQKYVYKLFVIIKQPLIKKIIVDC
jgi:hypothetical protein